MVLSTLRETRAGSSLALHTYQVQQELSALNEGKLRAEANSASLLDVSHVLSLPKVVILSPNLLEPPFAFWAAGPSSSRL